MSDYDKLLRYTFNLLAKKRYTSFEINTKLEKYLKRHDLEDDGVVQKVVDRLFELKYLDDEQYMKDFVSDRVQFKPRGRFMVAMELAKKGIDRKSVEEHWNSCVDEVAVAIGALDKKTRQWAKLDDRARKEKAFRHLASKGFAPDTIYKTIERCYNRDC